MDGYTVYQRYVALKLHFNSDRYDFVSAGGRTRTSKETYERRRDVMFFRTLGDKLRDKDVVPFFVAQFARSNTVWVGEMVLNYEAAMKVYRKWIGKFEAIFKIFEDDLSELRLFLESRELKEEDLFFTKNEYDHPLIFRFYLEGMITLETMIILDREYEFISRLDLALVDPVWKHHSRLFKKYGRFLKNINFKNMKITVDK